MKKLKIAIDVDGVLLNWYKNYCYMQGLKYSYTKTWDVVKGSFAPIANNINYWKNLEPIIRPNEIEFEFDVYLTSMPKEWLDARKKNLYDLGYPKVPVVATFDKYKYCIENDVDILIDDKPATAEKFQDHPNTKLIQFIPQYGIWNPVNEEMSFYTPERMNEIIKSLT